MGMSKDQIIKAITDYIFVKCDIKKWNEVYVGIAKDPEKRLFNEHKVKKQGVIWIYCPANSSTCAREVEKTLIAQGADGGPGGGDDDTTSVYAYKKTPDTVDC